MRGKLNTGLFSRIVATYIGGVAVSEGGCIYRGTTVNVLLFLCKLQEKSESILCLAYFHGLYSSIATALIITFSLLSHFEQL